VGEAAVLQPVLRRSGVPESSLSRRRRLNGTAYGRLTSARNEKSGEPMSAMSHLLSDHRSRRLRSAPASGDDATGGRRRSWTDDMLGVST
jgi:hypothetical protein